MIGNWNNDGVIFGILPKCLKNGDNPATFGIDFGGGPVSFPIYRGPSSYGSELLNFSQYIEYNDGIINPREAATDDGISNMLITPNIYDGNIGNDTDYTVEQWVYYQQTDTISYSPISIGANGFFSFRFGSSRGLSFFNKVAPTSVRVTSDVSLSPLPNGLHHIVAIKDGSVMKIYIDGAIPTYSREDEWTIGTLDLSDASSISISCNYNDNSSNIPTIKWHSYVEYKRALTESEVLQNYALGADYGGLFGYDNGDGTLTVTNSKIVAWDNSDCVFGIFPACLKRGSNPSSFQSVSDPDTTTKFPIYIGDSGSPPSEIQMYQYAKYDNSGYLGEATGNPYSYATLKVINHNIICNPVGGYTYELWINYIAPPSVIAFAVLSQKVGSAIYKIDFWSDGSVDFNYSKIGSGNNYARTSSSTLQNNTLTHLVFVRDEGELRIYYNGNEATYQVQESVDLTFDLTSDSPTFYCEYNGVFDKLYAYVEYNRALTLSEIQTNYVLGSTYGNLEGYDNGDGTMLLGATPVTSTPQLPQRRHTQRRREGLRTPGNAVQEARDLRAKSNRPVSSERAPGTPEKGWEDVNFFHSRKGKKLPGKHLKVKPREENFKDWLKG